MTTINLDDLQELLDAYRATNTLHDRALEQIRWLDAQLAQEYRYEKANLMKATTYESLTLIALQLAQALDNAAKKAVDSPLSERGSS